MQAIVTKYHGPTNSQGPRVKASAEAGSITLLWDHALDSDANHEVAARALLAKLGWDVRSDIVGGTMPRHCSHHNCYVLVPRVSP
jgi:hypothetical protein